MLRKTAAAVVCAVIAAGMTACGSEQPNANNGDIMQEVTTQAETETMTSAETESEIQDEAETETEEATSEKSETGGDENVMQSVDDGLKSYDSLSVEESSFITMATSVKDAFFYGDDNTEYAKEWYDDFVEKRKDWDDKKLAAVEKFATLGLNMVPVAGASDSGMYTAKFAYDGRTDVNAPTLTIKAGWEPLREYITDISMTISIDGEEYEIP